MVPQGSLQVTNPQPAIGAQPSIEARNSLRLSLLLCLAGVAMLAFEAYEVLSDGSYYPIVVGLGALLGILGLTGAVDRRVQLRMDAEGLRYRGLGFELFAWSEFSGVRIFQDQGNPTLQLTLVDPDSFWPRVGAVRRAGQRTFSRSHASIPLRPLDVASADIVLAATRYIDTRSRPTQRAPSIEALQVDGTLQNVALAILRFPERCLSCGGAPETQASITARRGIELGFVSIRTQMKLGLPACRSCLWKRRALFACLVPIPFVTFVLAFRWLVLTFPDLEESIPGLVLFIVFWGLVATIPFGLFRLARLADRWIWGVEAVKLLPGDERVKLRFRDPALGREVLLRSADPGR